MSIIKHKKLFEKQLIKIKGFESLNECQGINSHSILYLPEHQILVTAGIHERNEAEQELILFTMKATIDMSRNILNKLGNKKTNEYLSKIEKYKKRNSALFTQTKTNLIKETEIYQESFGKSKKTIKKTNSGQSKNVQKPLSKMNSFDSEEFTQNENGKFWNFKMTFD